MKSKILAIMLFAGMAIAACTTTKEGTMGTDSTMMDTSMTDPNMMDTDTTMRDTSTIPDSTQVNNY